MSHGGCDLYDTTSLIALPKTFLGATANIRVEDEGKYVAILNRFDHWPLVVLLHDILVIGRGVDAAICTPLHSPPTDLHQGATLLLFHVAMRSNNKKVMKVMYVVIG